MHLVETDFLSSGNCLLIRAIFLLVEAIIGIRGGKQFSKKELIIASGQLIFLLVETMFFSIFQRLLRLMETMFQENPSFRLVETDFRANNGFRKKKEKLLIKEYCFH